MTRSTSWSSSWRKVTTALANAAARSACSNGALKFSLASFSVTSRRLRATSRLALAAICSTSAFFQESVAQPSLRVLQLLLAMISPSAFEETVILNLFTYPAGTDGSGNLAIANGERGDRKSSLIIFNSVIVGPVCSAEDLTTQAEALPDPLKNRLTHPASYCQQRGQPSGKRVSISLQSVQSISAPIRYGAS